jgi:hypothetical protein
MPPTIGRTAELLLPASSIKTAKVVDCGTNPGSHFESSKKCNRNLRPRLARLDEESAVKRLCLKRGYIELVNRILEQNGRPIPSVSRSPNSPDSLSGAMS